MENIDGKVAKKDLLGLIAIAGLVFIGGLLETSLNVPFPKLAQDLHTSIFKCHMVNHS